MYEKALLEHGSGRKAADALGIPESTFRGRLKQERAGLPDSPARTKEQANPHSVIPEGYRAKGTSTLYDDMGNPRLQWVKTQVDPEAMRQMLKAAAEEFARDHITPSQPRFDDQVCDDDLLTVYILTDHHLGMMAWGEETGADWDLKIAEETLVRYFTRASYRSPKSKRAVLANLGDLLHFDGMLPVTPASRHVLDADTRFQKLIRTVIRALRLAVDILLERHQEVHVLNSTGNHDESSAPWLRECFAVLYENEPRVTVEIRPDPYYCVEHGKTSLFFHHGHKRRSKEIEGVFASKFREIYGRTSYSYAHTGHLHSYKGEDGQLMLIEQHRTLAAPDAYSSGGGYPSRRSACAITYSAKYGEESRVTIPIEAII